MYPVGRSLTPMNVIRAFKWENMRFKLLKPVLCSLIIALFGTGFAVGTVLLKSAALLLLESSTSAALVL